MTPGNTSINTHVLPSGWRIKYSVSYIFKFMKNRNILTVLDFLPLFKLVNILLCKES